MTDLNADVLLQIFNYLYVGDMLNMVKGSSRIYCYRQVQFPGLYNTITFNAYANSIEFGTNRTIETYPKSIEVHQFKIMKKIFKYFEGSIQRLEIKTSAMPFLTQFHVLTKIRQLIFNIRRKL